MEEAVLDDADQVTVGPVTFQVRVKEEETAESAPEVDTARARGPRPRLQPIYRTIL